MRYSDRCKSGCGIFLLFEGLPPTIIESQVLSHARRMIELGVNMEVWTFALTKAAYAQALQNLPKLHASYPNVTIRVFRGLKPAIPFSEVINAILLLSAFYRNNNKPAFVHARTEYGAAVAAVTKKMMGYKLIWDARGDTKAEFLETAGGLKKPWRWLAPMKLRSITNRLACAQKHSDFVIFVSDALRSLQRGVIPLNRTAIIPCVADESLFFFSNSLRDATRKRLGYAKNDVVVTYVGSTAVWQCIQETVNIMEKILLEFNHVKVLIISPSHIEFKNIFKQQWGDRIKFISVNLTEINSYLNASDIGILIRKPGPINFVASPVKYAEYSLAGLQVIQTGAVEQISKLGNLIGNTVHHNEISNWFKTPKQSGKNRAEISAKALLHLSRKSYDLDLKKVYEA